MLNVCSYIHTDNCGYEIMQYFIYLKFKRQVKLLFITKWSCSCESDRLSLEEALSLPSLRSDVGGDILDLCVTSQMELHTSCIGGG